MGISFLAPAFLLGITALAVPIIIHLVHRQKPEGTAFPSLMFLRQIPYKAQRRQKIRHWFLFLLRCLAIALIALAFARPLFQGSEPTAAFTSGGRDIVIAIDRSFSMGYGDRWGQGVAAARRVIDGIGPEDRVALVVFDHEAHAVSRPTSDRAAVQAMLDRQDLGVGMTDYSSALRLAQQLIADSDMPHREIVLITDFQRSGRSGQDEVQLPDGIRLTPVDLSTPDPSNLAVAAVNLTQQPRGNREEVIVSARVVNWGSMPRSSSVSMELNGTVLASLPVELDQNESETVVFEPVLVPAGTSRGIVRVQDNKLASDDAFFFVLSPGSSLSVLVLEGSNARENQSLYLARALSVGDDPSFAVDVKSVRSFRVEDLVGRSVVVLNDAPLPTGIGGTRITEFVQEGGGLLVVLGERAEQTWTGPLAAAAGGALRERVERTGNRGGAVTKVEFTHPVFDVFATPRSGDFASAKVFRYRAVAWPGGARVLASFDDGAPAMVERSLGEGRILVWSTTIDTYWNDLPLQPVFLPFTHQTAKYLGGYRPPRPWFNVSDVVDLWGYLARSEGAEEAVTALETGEQVIVESPSGDRKRLSGDDMLMEATERGFHEVQPAAEHELPPVLFAMNVDPVESDLSNLDVEEFVSTVSSEAAGGLGLEMAGPVTPADREKRQRMWWYLLIAALLMLLGETLISNRLSRAVR